MKRLLTRVDHPDDVVARSLAVIERFDDLAAEHADLTCLVDEAARLAGHPIGVLDLLHDQVIVSSTDAGLADAVLAAAISSGLRGRGAGPLLLSSGAIVTAASIDLADGRVGLTWCAVDPTDAPGPEIVVERLAAVAAATYAARKGERQPASQRTLLVRMLEGSASPESALQQLGLDPTRRHVVYAAEPVPERSVSPEVLAVALRRFLQIQLRAGIVGPFRSAVVAILSDRGDVAEVHDALRSAVAPTGIDVVGAYALAEGAIAPAWRGVAGALRRRAPLDVLIDADATAVCRALALATAELSESRDVRAVLALTVEDRRLLAVVADASSLRRAGVRLYLHHTTVAYRLEKLESVMGFRLAEPGGRRRLILALAGAETVSAALAEQSLSRPFRVAATGA